MSHTHGRFTVMVAFTLHIYLAFFVILVLVGTSPWGELGIVRGDALSLVRNVYVPTLFIMPLSVLVSSWCYRIWPLPVMVVGAFAAVLVYTPVAGVVYVGGVLGLTALWFSRPQNWRLAT